MRTYNSIFGKITLTDERLQHILEFHPDVRSHLRYFSSALADPDEQRPSIRDPAVIICYRKLPRQKRYLAIVVHTERRFIVTAYLAKRPKRDRL